MKDELSTKWTRIGLILIHVMKIFDALVTNVMLVATNLHRPFGENIILFIANITEVIIVSLPSFSEGEAL